ncbi:hypothetical protein CC2G_014615 [Coprinopsis cinerea AmutBmut pab1-1]|nr:hypothetical protein CC2G_014615 [Coprinopsis cinerea AmutBmut pab1-1]
MPHGDVTVSPPSPVIYSIQHNRIVLVLQLNATPGFQPCRPKSAMAPALQRDIDVHAVDPALM